MPRRVVSLHDSLFCCILGVMVTQLTRIQLLRMRAVFRSNHLGPGPHPDGSPQDVHGGGRSKKTSTSTTGSGISDVGASAKGRRAGRVSFRDYDGVTYSRPVYQVDDFGGRPERGMGLLSLTGSDRGKVYFTPVKKDGIGPTHGQMIRAVNPSSNVDNYVRFYFNPQGLEFNVTSAAVPVSGGDWETGAIDNIYKAMDRLAASGVPGESKVQIITPYSNDIFTTLKSNAIYFLQGVRAGFRH